MIITFAAFSPRSRRHSPAGCRRRWFRRVADSARVPVGAVPWESGASRGYTAALLCLLWIRLSVGAFVATSRRQPVSERIDDAKIHPRGTPHGRFRHHLPPLYTVLHHLPHSPPPSPTPETPLFHHFSPTFLTTNPHPATTLPTNSIDINPLLPRNTECSMVHQCNASDIACRMHALSITPHKRSAVWGWAISSSICVPAARALYPSLK